MAEGTFSKTRSSGDKLVGRRLAGKYQIIELLTRGAMGKIYSAVHVEERRECAIKVLDVRHLGDAKDEFTARFFREASIAAKIAHPNVVNVYDYGRTEDNVYYLAMEYLHGRTLEAELREKKRLPWQRAVEITSQICRGLRAAHGFDVLHRDLKPANVFLVDTGDGTTMAKIVDFGLAKILVDDDSEEEQLTQVGSFVGSARYACPEQIAGTKDIDSRADLYAVGVMLYEMLTGTPPFDGPNEASIMVAHLNSTPRPFAVIAPGLVVPAEIERVVFRAMSRERAGRPASAAELLEQLKAASGLASLMVTNASGWGAAGSEPMPAAGSPPLATPLPDPHGAMPPQSTLAGVSPDYAGSAGASLDFEPRGLAAWQSRARPYATWIGVGAGLAILVSIGVVAATFSTPSAAGPGALPDGMGRLELTSGSLPCRVSVDGVLQGTTPVDPVVLPPALHTVAWTCTDGRTGSTQARVRAGETATARVGD